MVEGVVEEGDFKLLKDVVGTDWRNECVRN